MPDQKFAQAPKGSSIAPSDSKVTRIPAERMNVSPGQSIVIRFPGAEHAYRGSIIGFDPFDYIIVQAPIPSALRSNLRDEHIVLKYIRKGTIYGFTSSVRKSITDPAPLVFIDYPDFIEKIELRRDDRLDVSMDGILMTENGHHECRIENISLTGCKLSVAGRSRKEVAGIAIDDTLMVALNMGAEGVIKLPAAVRTLSPEKGAISMGAMFLDLNEYNAEILERYLERVRRLTR